MQIIEKERTVIFHSKEEFIAYVQYCHLIGHENRWTSQQLAQLNTWPTSFILGNIDILNAFNEIYNENT